MVGVWVRVCTCVYVCTVLCVCVHSACPEELNTRSLKEGGLCFLVSCSQARSMVVGWHGSPEYVFVNE